MDARNPWPWIMVLLGLLALLIGAIDPLEGSLLVLPGMALLFAGALVARSAQRRLLLWGLLLGAAGIAALFALSAAGGLGGRTGRSNWWLLALAPYPVGWVLGLVGAVRTLMELSRRLRAEPDRS